MTALEIKPMPLTSAPVQALIAALNAELSERYPEEGANHFRLDEEEVKPGAGVLLVAYLDGEAVGCGAVRRLEDDSAELKRMYTVPAARGQGVASRLLSALEQQARALRARRVVLETGERQHAAVQLYRRHGYRIIDRFGEYVDSPLSLCMGKELTA